LDIQNWLSSIRKQCPPPKETLCLRSERPWRKTILFKGQAKIPIWLVSDSILLQLVELWRAISIIYRWAPSITFGK
jgi:hypothetical protein